jgi:hypothetical protein
MPNLNRILYSMCYDMLAQEHFAYKTSRGLAIVCPETPVWLCGDARLFFNKFLDEYKNPLIGIVAEKKTAIECAEIYSQRTGIAFTYKELIAYSLPNEVSLVKNFGELRTASAADMPLILEWINAFYAETLDVAFPETAISDENKTKSPAPQIFILFDSRPVAMGMLSGIGERINLVYVLPELRGKGYGKALVTTLAEKVRARGKLPVLYTACDNAAANKLYTSLGFREAGRLTEVGFTATSVE